LKGSSISGFADILDLLPRSGSSQDVLLWKLLLAGILAIIIGIFINKGLSRLLRQFAAAITRRAENTSRGDQLIQIKRTETMLSVGGAVLRTLIIGFCLYLAWRLVNPTSAPVALIGASTFFIVLGAATIGPLLRDITSGILMIAEQWYNVGDHIMVDPFWELQGVVEQMNLRSTRIRTLSGEAVWIHNQHIQAVRVARRGVRTMSIDIFVNNLEVARRQINKTLSNMPTGPTMIASPLTITEEEELGTLWRITITGQTAPGREWLIEDFAVNALKKHDERKKEQVIVHGPIVRYTDTVAERRFTRSMQKRA
jgi:small conductance mechanosensitive channel